MAPELFSADLQDYDGFQTDVYSLGKEAPACCMRTYRLSRVEMGQTSSPGNTSIKV